METINFWFSETLGAGSLYSLEKLIEWKLFLIAVPTSCILVPLLAREINWMETVATEKDREALALPSTR